MLLDTLLIRCSGLIAVFLLGLIIRRSSSVGHWAAESNEFQSKYSTDEFEYDDNYNIMVIYEGHIVNCTLSSSGHYKQISVSVSAFGERFLLDLRLNTYLFASNYIEKSVTRSGDVHHVVNHVEKHCYYIGTVRDRAESIAAASTCNGLVGYFAIGNRTYHIDPRSDHLHGEHAIYRSRGNSKSMNKCGADHIVLKNLYNHAKSKTRLKRSFNWPQDEDKKDKVVELYVANAFSQFVSKERNVNTVTQRTKDMVNFASATYQPLGIYWVLVGVEVWTEYDAINITHLDVDGTLNSWCSYRMVNINPNHYNDVGVLVTAAGFNGGVIGKATVDTMCSNRFSAAIIADLKTSVAFVGSTMAHEVGHVFGLIHDTENCSCVDKGGHCIMQAMPNSVVPATNWSQCSLQQFGISFEKGKDACLYDAPQIIFQSSPYCGNGIVESGEDCDCGRSSSMDCNSNCCNSTTCVLIGSASCASGRCCEVSSCQILPANTECRSKSDDCDVAEFCSGNSSNCPSDTYKPDGTNCITNAINDTAYCYKGRCNSHLSQCQLLWGEGTKVAAERCYYLFNVKGIFYGNCGLEWLSRVSYIPCAQSDAMCGRLQCDDNSKALVSYEDSYYFLATASINANSCHSVIFDLGLRVQDPGLVPDGAKCGNEMVCISQKCVSINTLFKPSCANSCGGNEVCNNLGRCQVVNYEDPSTPRTLTQTSRTTKRATASKGTTTLITSTKTSTETSSTTTPTTTISSLMTTQLTISSTASSTTATTTTSPTTTSSTSSTTITSSTTTTLLAAIISSTLKYESVMPTEGGEGTFCVYIDTNQTGLATPLNLNMFLANRMAGFSASSKSFFPSLEGNQFFYTEICAGILPSKKAFLVTVGGFPALSFDWFSTSQNGVDSGCRGGVLSLTRQVGVFLSQWGDGVYSSNQMETSWSMFSITDTMMYSSHLLAITGTGSSSSYGQLPLTNFISSPNSSSIYNAATTAYSCDSKAVGYFFSLSVGVAAGDNATVNLEVSGMNYNFEMTRQNSQSTGTTTLARTVIIPCATEAKMILTNGQVVSGINLMSFTAFPYELKTQRSVSWAGYRTSDWSSSGTMTFDLWLLRSGLTSDQNTSMIQIPKGGYYYVYLSAGIHQGRQLNMVLMKNAKIVFGLTRTATDSDGNDTIGHGLVTYLRRNDRLTVEAHTSTFSSNTGLHTSFIGMLLYEA